MGRHTVTAGDALWSAAAAKARAQGTSLNDVITGALAAYTGAVTVLGITIVPDVRMPPGTAALLSPGCKPVPFALPGPPPGGQPWSRPGATPLQDIREIEREGRQRTSRPAGE
jgi:hypothetical protein